MAMLTLFATEKSPNQLVQVSCAMPIVSGPSSDSHINLGADSVRIPTSTWERDSGDSYGIPTSTWERDSGDSHINLGAGLWHINLGAGLWESLARAPRARVMGVNLASSCIRWKPVARTMMMKRPTAARLVSMGWIRVREDSVLFGNRRSLGFPRRAAATLLQGH